MAEIIGIELTKKLPEQAVVESTYEIEGSAKLFDIVGAPPFIYAQVQHKEWYKPDFTEDKDYIKAWPVPFTGNFSIAFKPEKEGDYEVTVLTTPAPLSLPAVGVFPILAKSEVMKVSVGQKPPSVFRFAGVTIDGNTVQLTDHDADAGLLIQKKVTDTLEIIPSFEWVGVSKSATISIKVGYKDLLGGFTPKTDAYTRNIELPESPDTPYSSVLAEPIIIPLTACGDLDDGAIEIVAKLPGMSDYITQVWNVFATKAPVVAFRFSSIVIDGNTVQLTDHDADSNLLLVKTTTDNLTVIPVFEWQGPLKTATISIKAGYKDWTGGFTPKSGAYTRNIELPESIETVYRGQLSSPINIPLTACGGLDDGALEIVLKISGVSDYISHIWDVYNTKAGEEEIAFALSQPTATPSPVSPGTNVTITCPVTSNSNKVLSVTAKFLIYEGSILPGHGTLLDTKSTTFSISPGQTYNATVSHTAAAGTIDRRDVGVQIIVNSVVKAEDEWDDVFYVTAAGGPATLSASHSNGSCSYSFSGFQPNATVTLTVTQTGGSVTKTANSSGAGSGSFNDTDAPGTYTLKATDTYGHSATASFTIADIIAFGLSQPTATPSTVVSGANVTIACPVKSNSNKVLSVTAKFLIYEGSILPGHGTLLDTKNTTFSISPGQTYNATVSHTAAAGTIDRRDVGVQIIVNSVVKAEDEWDDVFYVTAAGGPASLSASHSNGVCSYSFSGFQPNATVTLQVVGGGYVTKTANSSGAGSGSFNDTDAAGTYTLKATDTYGHSATASFTIADIIAFGLSQPAANPSTAVSGANVTITCPVKSNSNKVLSVTAKFLIYEGSILPGHGTLLDTKNTTFSISPGQTYNATVSHTTVAGTIDRRDVGVQIIVNSVVKAEDEWDDVFYVTAAGGQASLNASYSGGVVSFSFSGFQANATVTLTVTQTGGYFTKTANSSGSGSGSFYDNDPAGTYTLKATDTYGHSATATFTK